MANPRRKAHKDTKWPADKVERRPVKDLAPYARNPRLHTPEQIQQIARSIQEFGWTNPVLIDEGGEIIAGHGRVLAAERLKIAEVPVIVAEGWSEEQRWAYRIADNQLTMIGGWDEEALRAEITGLAEMEFDLSLTALDEGWIEGLLADAEDDEEVDETYTRKIEPPIYEPSDSPPAVTDLTDTRRTEKLVAEIDAAGLPEDVAGFLRAAAQRHTVFDYRRIADFYAHAPAEVQALMERSALVIIDFDKAIENGFVRVSQRLADIVAQRQAEDE
ncbi:MAG: ParB/Srx family N-terminal domain-containing protein [Jiangellaceae bacterium]